MYNMQPFLENITPAVSSRPDQRHIAHKIVILPHAVSPPPLNFAIRGFGSVGLLELDMQVPVFLWALL